MRNVSKLRFFTIPAILFLQCFLIPWASWSQDGFSIINNDKIDYFAVSLTIVAGIYCLFTIFLLETKKRKVQNKQFICLIGAILTLILLSINLIIFVRNYPIISLTYDYIFYSLGITLSLFELVINFVLYTCDFALKNVKIEHTGVYVNTNGLSEEQKINLNNNVEVVYEALDDASGLKEKIILLTKGLKKSNSEIISEIDKTGEFAGMKFNNTIKDGE